MKAPPIIQYWHSKQLPSKVADAVESFATHNPDSQHLVFDETGAERFIATHLSIRELTAFQTCGVPAMQADYFRYCAVLILGGVYIDADMQCINDLGSLLDRQSAGALFGSDVISAAEAGAPRGLPDPVGRYRSVDNGFFAFEKPFDPLLRLAVEIATSNIEKRIADGAQGVWLTAGPGIFTSMYLLHCLGSLDAFIRRAMGTVLECSSHLFCEIVEDPERISPIFDRVILRPRQDRTAWIRPVRVAQYKSCHWQLIKGTIYR